MYLAIIILPLFGSIASGFFGRKIGVTGAQIITCTAIIITTVMAVIAFSEVGLNSIPAFFHMFRWIDSESLNIGWAFNFDSLTVSMLLPVLIISSLVHLYSIGYMSNDPHNQRFFSYLSLFTFMMVILVTANNYLLMFVGWEGVGVCSYLLVCFWYTRVAANQSALSAFLTNRVGDCLLTVGMFAIISSFGNLDYATVFSLAPYMNENLITLIGVCLLIGAMAKSSQVGLHVWLPMAMEGPTPVSALIHAATMVTAGVYLLMRSSPLIEYSSTVLMLCLLLGAITTVFSSLIGLFQQDIKKVIAYSTMSQLGMMVIAVGLSCYNVALFHLINHAFYKGLLFLGAGSVIHSVADNQDFRRYGGLRPFLPLTYSVMLIASLSLVAFPYMTGFYSKDFILEAAYGQFSFSSTAVYIIATIGAMFTTLYSVKVLYLTFLTNPNGPLINYKKAHEGDIFMSLPLVILAVFSIFFGFISKDMFIGLGSGFFTDNALFVHPCHEIMIDTEFGVPTLFKLLPLVFTILNSIIAIVLSEYLAITIVYFKLSRIGYNIFGFFNQRFLIELFYNKYITGLILILGGQTTKVLDKGSIEYIGPYGLENGLLNISNNISKLSTGVITSYGLYILIGVIFNIIFNIYIRDTIVIIILVASLTISIKSIHSTDRYIGSIHKTILHSSCFPIGNKYLNNGTLIELIWTITSALILVLIAFPSFRLLYLMDEVTSPSLSVLAEGHQWYWSYEYPNLLNSDGDFIEFDSYSVPEIMHSKSYLVSEILGYIKDFICKPIECSSPSFNPLDTSASANPTPSTGSNGPIDIHFDFSHINNLMNELKHGMQNARDSLTEFRIKEIQESIDGSLAEFRSLGKEAMRQSVVCFGHLYITVETIENKIGYEGLHESLVESKRIAGENIGKIKIDEGLLKSDPIKYSKTGIKYTNLQRESLHSGFNVLKKFVTNNTYMTRGDKQDTLNAIKYVYVTTDGIYDADIKVHKKTIESSKILAELKRSKSK